DHFGADLGRLLFGCLHALVAELLRVNTQGIANARTEAHRLHQERGQPPDILKAGAVGEILERLGALNTRTDLGIHEDQLGTQLRMADTQLISDSLQSGSEAQPRFNTDNQQVESIRKARA